MSARPAAAALGGLFLVLLSAVPTGGLEAQTATQPEVVSLEFEGNEAFSDRTLANAILTRQTRCRSFVLQPFCWAGREFALDRAFLNQRWLRDDYLRLHLFYRWRGYGEVQVDTVLHRPTETTVEVTFQVREGTPHRVATLEFRGLEELGNGELVADLPIREGDPLNRVVLEAARDTLTRRLRNRGYAHADVLRNLDIPDDSYDAGVEFDVSTGPRARFGPIRVEGTEEVEERVVRRMLPFEEGNFYSQELVFEGQRNLFNLEIFRRTQLTPDLQHDPDSIVPVRVVVAEGRKHRIRTGGGWSSADCLNAEARWSSRNFVGGARRLVLRSRLSNVLASNLDESICWDAGTDEFGRINWIVSADFTQPFFLGPRNSLFASAFVEHQTLQEVFVRDAFGLNLGVTRTLGRATPLTFSYRPQRVSLRAAETFFCVSFLVCDRDDIVLLQRGNWLAPVGASLTFDRTDRSVSPREGYRFMVDLEHASGLTLSDFGHNRVVTEVAAFGEITPDVVFATRLRGGWIRARAFGELEGDPRIAHPQKRFFAGGANSVRGFSQNQLGPRVLTVAPDSLVFPVEGRPAAVCTPEEVADQSCDPSMLGEGQFESRPTGGGMLVEGSLELRFPLTERNWSGAMFMDFGQVWSEARDARATDVRLTPGLGVRYRTPVGPIRVDVAYRPARDERLPVVTTRIVPFDPEIHREGDRMEGPDGTVLDWVAVDDLAVLDPRVPFDEREGFLRRLQLHISIGHAF